MAAVLGLDCYEGQEWKQTAIDETDSSFVFCYDTKMAQEVMSEQYCQEARFAGRAWLQGYRWQINELGEANVVPAAGQRVQGVVYAVPTARLAAEQSALAAAGKWQTRTELVQLTAPLASVFQRINYRAAAGSGQQQGPLACCLWLDAVHTADGRASDPHYVALLCRAARQSHLSWTYLASSVAPFLPAGVSFSSFSAPETEQYLVFVYGSLKMGLSNHQVLQQGGASFAGHYVLHGARLYSLVLFPAAREADGHLLGELYAVNGATLRALDRLESYQEEKADESSAEPMYVRCPVWVVEVGGLRAVRALVYFYADPLPDSSCVSSGFWSKPVV